MKKLLLLCALFVALPVRAAPLPVAASFSILGDLVQNVGGERIELVTLVGPDQDAHIFQPTPADVQKLAQTRLFFINGLGFEGWLKRLQQASRYNGKVVTVTRGIEPLAMKHNDHGHAYDPHVWQDPERVKQMVGNIAEALSAADPAGAAYYRTRAADYRTQIGSLLVWAQNEIASVPAAKRVVLTSHDAFGYLGQRFGIRLISPQGVSTETEASARDVAGLIRQMKQSGIRAVFMENISNPRLTEQIARETGAKPGPKLYSDALSRNPDAASYISMYRYNIATLVAGMRTN